MLRTVAQWHLGVTLLDSGYCGQDLVTAIACMSLVTAVKMGRWNEGKVMEEKELHGPRRACALE